MSGHTAHRRIVALMAALAALLLVPSAGARAEPPPGLVEVAVTARVLDISRIQETMGEMAAQLELTLRWTDPDLGFDSVQRGTGRLEFTGRAAAQQLDTMWNPAASLRTVTGTPRQDELGLLIYAGGEVVLVRTVEANFRIVTDMSAFPFDRKALPIELSSARYSEDRVAFTERGEDAALSSAVETPRAYGWRLAGLSFEPGSITAWNGETRSLLTIRVRAIRDSVPFAIRIFVPFLMVMVSPLLVLWAPDSNNFSKGQLIFSGMLALVALSFTLEGNFPGSISMPTPVSTILTTGFLFLVFCLVLNMTAMNPEAGWARRHPFVAGEVRGLIKWAVPLAMLTIWGSIVLQAVV